MEPCYLVLQRPLAWGGTTGHSVCLVTWLGLRVGREGGCAEEVGRRQGPQNSRVWGAGGPRQEWGAKE